MSLKLSKYLFRSFGRPIGQTLVETLLAAAVIVIGAVSLISLLINVRVTSEASFENIQAIHLASEAVEAVRYVRDSNWLKIENGENYAFNQNLFLPEPAPVYPDYDGILVWDPTAPNADAAMQIDFTNNAISEDSAIVYQDSSGYFRQTMTSPVPPTWTATKYRRWITLYPICFQPAASGSEVVVTGNGQSCADIDPSYYQIGIQIQAQVQWNDRGGLVHDRAVEERVYNWKYPNPEFADAVF